MLNSVTIIGNLAADPQLKAVGHEQESRSVCELRVAVNRGFKESDGTDFFDVSVWNGLGARCAEFLSKGSKVAIQGQLRVSQWTMDDGQKRSRVFIQVGAGGAVEFLSPKPQAHQETHAPEVSSEPQFVNPAHVQVTGPGFVTGIVTPAETPAEQPPAGTALAIPF